MVGWPSGSLKVTFWMIFWAKLDFQIFDPAVVPSEGPILEVSRALLRHKNFDGKTKMSKIEKDEDWVGWSSRRLKMRFQMIFWAKFDFQNFNPTVIPLEGPTLEASRGLLRYTNFDGETKISKIEKDEDWIGWPSRSLKMTFEVIFSVKMDFQIFCSAVIPSEGPSLEASKESYWSIQNLAARQTCGKSKKTRIGCMGSPEDLKLHFISSFEIINFSTTVCFL